MLSAFVSFADGASSEGVVTIGSAQSFLWRTATSSPAKLALDWPAGAVGAELTVIPGVGGAAVTYPITDTSLETYDYAFTPPTKPGEERVESFTIVYFDGDGKTLASASAKLGIVIGTANAATVPCRVKGIDDARWPKCKGNVVVPIPEGAANLRLDGQVLAATPDAPGWWQYDLDARPHVTVLEIDGSDVERTLCPSGGAVLIVR